MNINIFKVVDKVLKDNEKIKESLSLQAKQRMEGLVNSGDFKEFRRAASTMLSDLMKDGFDELEVKEWLSILVNEMIVREANEAIEVDGQDIVINGHRYVQVFPPSKWSGSGGINWSALGTVSIKETEEFIQALQKAIEVAKQSGVTESKEVTK
jgi:hypothetical protein